MKYNPIGMLGLLCLTFTFLLSLPVNAQMSVTSGFSAADLATKLVGPGVTITNAVLVCPNGASGTFSAGPVNEVGFNKGVLLTSGQVSIAANPNNLSGAGTNNNAAGDATLNGLIPGFTAYDACVLEFDLEAVGNQVSFEYVFASEEYEEYYCKIYNDVFGFFVTGPNPAGGNYSMLNIALVPGTTTPVSVNNVGPASCNGIDNRTLYQNMAGATTLQYDGKTKVLKAELALKPCKKYRFKRNDKL